MQQAEKLSPFIRIALYILTGWLGGLGVDAEAIELIRTDPAILAAITGAVVSLWYATAKWRGWST